MSNKPQAAALLTALLCERWFNDPRTPAKRLPWIDGTVCAMRWAQLASQVVRCRGNINNPDRMAKRLESLNKQLTGCCVRLTGDLVLESSDVNRPLVGVWP